MDGIVAENNNKKRMCIICIFRLSKFRAFVISEISKKNKEFEAIKKKLDNPSFIDKAPKAIVAKEGLKMQRLDEVIKNLEHKKSLILEI